MNYIFLHFIKGIFWLIYWLLLWNEPPNTTLHKRTNIEANFPKKEEKIT